MYTSGIKIRKPKARKDVKDKGLCFLTGNLQGRKKQSERNGGVHRLDES